MTPALVIEVRRQEGSALRDALDHGRPFDYLNTAPAGFLVAWPVIRQVRPRLAEAV